MLDDRERVHATHPGRKTRAYEVAPCEIRTPAGDPFKERHQWIDGEVDCGEIAGQIVAGRGALPEGKLLAHFPGRLFRGWAGREPRAGFGEIVVRLADHPPLDCALARFTSEKRRAVWPSVLDILDDGRRFGEDEVVVDQHRNAPARVERAVFLGLQIAVGKGQ